MSKPYKFQNSTSEETIWRLCDIIIGLMEGDGPEDACDALRELGRIDENEMIVY